MQPDDLARLLQSLRQGLTQLLGEQLEAVYLYGSQARGQARSDSDVDILVVVSEPYDYFDLIERTGLLASELSLEYDTVISLAFISKENYKQRQTPFMLNVRREGVRV